MTFTHEDAQSEAFTAYIAGELPYNPYSPPSSTSTSITKCDCCNHQITVHVLVDHDYETNLCVRCLQDVEDLTTVEVLVSL